MAIPKQVEQQMKEIEELERSLTAQSEGIEAQHEPQADSQPVQEQPTEPVAQEPVAEAKPVETDWEQKYKSLQGHFNAEVPKLHQQNKELAGQVQAMQQQLAELHKPKPQEPVEDRLVSEKDEEQFGADLIDVQRRVAKEVMREMVNPLKVELAQRDAKIAQLEASLGKTSGDVTAMSFEQQLERAIPDFTRINEDPKWVAWLDEIDPYTQEPRRSYAEWVYNQGDIAKLRKIVDFFKGSTGQQLQDQQRQQRQTELQRQVAPSRTATASTVPQGERFYTEAEISRLWNRVRELAIAGQNDEAAKLDRELSLAEVQGRVRG